MNSHIAAKLADTIADMVRAQVLDMTKDSDDEVGYDTYTPRQTLTDVIDELIVSVTGPKE
jgi:hypothetical protein